jgi:hypothetical protein
MKAIQSAAFPTVYLRMDGTGMAAPNADGGGTVNCQSGVAAFETFEVQPQPDGTVALASSVFPDVYLRMDGRGVKSTTDSGAGVVNCAYGVGPWERFHERPQPDGTVALESAAFPGVYLRMEAAGIHEFAASGGGMVNCQFGAGPWERFHLRDVAAEPRPTEPSSATFRASDYESDNLALTDPATVYVVDMTSVAGGELDAYDFSASAGVAGPAVPPPDVDQASSAT